MNSDSAIGAPNTPLVSGDIVRPTWSDFPEAESSASSQPKSLFGIPSPTDAEMVTEMGQAGFAQNFLNASEYPEVWLTAAGWRGLGRDYLQAIDDEHTGKNTNADREARINQSSSEARKLWGNVGGSLTNWSNYPSVSALGISGPLAQSADIIRPQAIQNPTPTEWHPPWTDRLVPAEPVQAQPRKYEAFKGEDLPSDTNPLQGQYANLTWDHFPAVA